jgi:hypothetical protein
MADTIFFNVDGGFFPEGVASFALGFLALFAGLFSVTDVRGDECELGVAPPSLLTCPCLDPRGVCPPLTFGDEFSEVLGIRLRWLHPMHLRADWLAGPGGSWGE